MDTRRILRVLPQVQLAESYNAKVHLLQHVYIVGKYIPNRWYRANGAKTLLKVIQWLLLPVGIFGNSILYAFFCYGAGLGLQLFLPDILPTISASSGHLSLTVLFIFSILLGTFSEFEMMGWTDIQAAQSVRYFRILPKDYIIAYELLEGGRGLLARTVVFGIFFAAVKLPFWYGLTFALLLAGLRIATRYAGLLIYQKTSYLSSSIKDRVLLIGNFILLILGCFLIYLGEKFSPQLFMGWLAGVLGFLLWSFVFHQVKQKPSLDILIRGLLTHDMLQAAATAADNIETVTVEVKEKDYDLQEQFQADTTLTGVVYLNQIFMKRLGRKLRKGVFIRLGFILTITFGVWIADFIGTLEQSRFTNDQVFWQYLFATVMLGYLFYIGESFMKFCFYHLDRPLLKHSYYRRQDVIIATLRTRFKSCLSHNFPIFVSLNIAYVSFYMLFFKWDWIGVTFILIGQLLSVVFFSLFFQYVYFLLQPFNDGMQSKSKIYTVLSATFYYLVYMILRFSYTASVVVLWIILGSLLLILLLGYLAVLKLAPKTFKLRS